MKTFSISNSSFQWSITRYLIALVLAAVLSACGESKVENELILIKFPHSTTPASPKGRAADHFKELVEERLAGRVAVEVYPSSQLLSDEDSIDALAFGEIQMIAVPMSKLDRLTNVYHLYDLPFLFPDINTVEKFQSTKEGKEMLNALEDRGFKGLTYWHNGMKQFGGPVPMRKPEDANGLKFRIMESDVLEAQVLQIGGNPQKMAFGEVYQALQTGAVDAQENTWSNIYSSKFYEVQDYITVTNHGYIGYLIAVNPAFWEGLPEDIRTEMDAIVRESAVWANEQALVINQQGRERILASGQSEIVELEPDQLSAWQSAMRPVWNKFEDNIGKELIQAALSSAQ
jgi:C4-dicarboxylate-binding protein DctP